MIGAALAVVWSVAAAAPDGPTTAYEARMSEARRSLATGDPDAARQACRGAIAAAPQAGLKGRAAAHALCGRIARAQDRPAQAARHFAAAAHDLVGSPRDRRRRLAQRRAAARAAKDAAQAQAVTELLRHDARMQGYLRRPRRRGAALDAALERLEAARKAYRADRDAHQARLARATRALVEASSGAPEGVEAKVKDLLGHVAPKVAATAWRAVYRARREADDVPGAAEAAIRLDMLRFDDAPEARRRFARSRALERACQALDAAEGPGACTRRQLRLRGFAALEDHSERRVPGALAPEQVARVHADALPALEQCVLGVARSAKDDFRNVDLRISWTIGPDGAPMGIEVWPSRHADALEPCTQGTVAWFRYPRPDPEAQRTNVTIPYRLD